MSQIIVSQNITFDFCRGFSSLPDRSLSLDDEMCQNLEDLARQVLILTRYTFCMLCWVI